MCTALNRGQNLAARGVHGTRSRDGRLDFEGYGRE